MITLIRHIRMLVDNTRLTREQYALIKSQRELIETQRETHARQMQTAALEHVREQHRLALGWLLSMERPEVDLREEVAAIEQVLGNQVAALEEHIL